MSLEFTRSRKASGRAARRIVRQVQRPAEELRQGTSEEREIRKVKSDVYLTATPSVSPLRPPRWGPRSRETTDGTSV